MPATFRLDEFAIVPDGAISERDRARFTGIGFDLVSASLIVFLGQIFLYLSRPDTFAMPTRTRSFSMAARPKMFTSPDRA